jgi:hypothetical protein
MLYEPNEEGGEEERETEDIYENDNDLEVTIRGKWIFDGAETLAEAIDLLEDYKYYLESLQADGFELREPVEDDYGHLQRETK